MPKKKASTKEPADDVKVNAEEAALLLKANKANMARQVARGQPLRRWQLEQLEGIANGKDKEDKKIWAKNKTHLCNLLGISRPLLYRLEKKLGAPVPRADGSHPLDEWKAHYERHKHQGANQHSTSEFSDDDPRQRYSLGKLNYEFEEQKLDYEIKAGKYVRKDETREAIFKANEKVKAELRRVFEQTLPSLYAQYAGDETECRKLNEEALAEVLAMLHEIK